ncbi:MAG: hypothetical protein KAJ21_06230, partial [Thermoplasmatales archaeon]|nr:hypothetical protein [Thermoplasmatales archaeon]
LLLADYDIDRHYILKSPNRQKELRKKVIFLFCTKIRKKTLNNIRYIKFITEIRNENIDT